MSFINKMSLDDVLKVKYDEHGDVLNVEELIKELYVVLSDPISDKKEDISSISLVKSPQITPQAQDLEYCCELVLYVRQLLENSASNFLDYLPKIIFQNPSDLHQNARNAYYAYTMLSSSGRYESLPRF